MTFNWKNPNHWILLSASLSLILLAGYGMYQAELTPGLEILMIIGSLGYLSGLLLSISHFSRRTAIIFSIVYASFAIVYLIGNKYQAYAPLTWSERVSDIVLDQADWINKAFNGGTSREPLIFVVHTSIIFWIIGHTAAWWTFRKQGIWRAILPAGAVLLSVVFYYYGPRPLWIYLAFYVLIAFIYISLTHLDNQQEEWYTAAVRFEPTISYNFTIAGLIVALSALLVAWQAPTFTANNAVNNALSGTNPAWIELQDNWTRLFSALRSYSTSTTDSVPNSLALGGPRNVSNTFIMDIFVSEELPYAYWHQLSYESYSDGRWNAPIGDQTIRIPDDGFFDIPEFSSREVITQTVRNYIPNSGQIYGLPDIVGSDKQMFVTSQIDDRGQELISMVQSRYVLPQNDTYTTQSLISMATQNDLRRDSQNYPEWITPYLNTGGSVSSQTADLASRLATGYDNPYDISISIQDYLRENIEYNDQIEAPPDNVNEIDYFLYDIQAGYCNYYATAMVMMLRSQGIPARPSVGFAAGEFIEDANLYRVRAKDSHMWVDVYFPSHGWVPFEPTAAIPVPNRPVGDDPTGIQREVPQPLDDRLGPGDFDEPFFDEGLDFEAVTDPLPEGGPSIDLSQLLTWPALIGFALVIMAGGASAATVQINRRAEGDIGRSHDHLGKWGERIGLDMDDAETPYERAEILSKAIPDGQRSIFSLTSQFVQTKFSSRQEPTAGFNPRDEWRQVRPYLIRKAFAHRMRTLRRRLPF
ncbi:MAG: transglutaminase domain-containing protein [Chloroflexota bacterium]